jgi:outer membrane protein TolC
MLKPYFQWTSHLISQPGRLTDLEVNYDVKHLYYAIVMAGQKFAIAKDTLARMESTLGVTEKLNETGSGTVKKTDYLRTKSVVETQDQVNLKAPDCTVRQK